jgi:hypothetical protein
MQRILDVSVDTISALLSLMLLHHLPECLIVRCFLLCTDGRLRSSPRKIKYGGNGGYSARGTRYLALLPNQAKATLVRRAECKSVPFVLQPRTETAHMSISHSRERERL